jgi:2-polyprenyl-6-methoxyphenol hydroxylase-like FAD-dependent oxidoreductase
MTHSRDARIAVIGAGPGGLTLARVLQRNGITPTVYEHDRGPADRPQGGTLDMQEGSGQAALAAAGLLDRFLAASRPEGQDTRLLDRSGAVLFEAISPEGETANPEMDRGDLRALLLGSLAPDTIVWGRHLAGVRPAGDGTYRLEFGDGGTETFDLVVGADGAWSKVRPLLSPDVPVYSGVTFVEIAIRDIDDAHPELAALVGRGGMSALSDNQGLMAQRNSRSVVRVYVAFRRPEHWLHDQGVDESDPAQMRAALLEMFTGWGPRLRELLVACENSFIVRSIMALPVPQRWAHRPGVTLLGDAAHLMSPFGGQGANLAMLDGADLAAALATESDLDGAVRRYEETMFPRSARAAAFSESGIRRAIADDAPAHSLAIMNAMAAGRNPMEQNA